MAPPSRFLAHFPEEVVEMTVYAALPLRPQTLDSPPKTSSTCPTARVVGATDPHLTLTVAQPRTQTPP